MDWAIQVPLWYSVLLKYNLFNRSEQSNDEKQSWADNMVDWKVIENTSNPQRFFFLITVLGSIISESFFGGVKHGHLSDLNGNWETELA